MRREAELEEAIRVCERDLETAIGERDWTKALHSQMAIKIFLWCLGDRERRIRFTEEPAEEPKGRFDFLKKRKKKESQYEMGF